MFYNLNCAQPKILNWMLTKDHRQFLHWQFLYFKKRIIPLQPAMILQQVGVSKENLCCNISSIVYQLYFAILCPLN